MMFNLFMMFSILQWNARSLIANGQEFKKLIRDFEVKPDFLCVQETWLKPHLDFVVPGYICLRKDRSDQSGGGCATFIKSGIQYKVCEYELSLECLIVEVWSHQGKLSLVNFYNPCKPLGLAELTKVTK